MRRSRGTLAFFDMGELRARVGGSSPVDSPAPTARRSTGRSVSDVPYGGWCPLGGLAEDLTEPPGLLRRRTRCCARRRGPTSTTGRRCNVRDSRRDPAGDPARHRAERRHGVHARRGRPARPPPPAHRRRRPGRRPAPGWTSLPPGVTLNVAGPPEQGTRHLPRRHLAARRAGRVSGRCAASKGSWGDELDVGAAMAVQPDPAPAVAGWSASRRLSRRCTSSSSTVNVVRLRPGLAGTDDDAGGVVQRRS